jgi:hypothetical protein
MVQVTSNFTYHDIVDTSGHVLKTELVSKVHFHFRFFKTPRNIIYANVPSYFFYQAPQ